MTAGSPRSNAATWPQIVAAMAGLAAIHGLVVVPAILSQAQVQASLLVEARMQQRTEDLNRREDQILKRIDTLEGRLEIRLTGIEEKIK